MSSHRTSHTQQAVVIVPMKHAHNSFAPLMRGLRRHIQRLGLPWLVCELSMQDLWRGSELAAKRRGPLILAGIVRDQDCEYWRQKHNIELDFVVSAAANTHIPNSWIVMVDNTSVGSQAVDHLYAAGYRHLAFWGSFDSGPAAIRQQAAQERAAHYHIPLEFIISHGRGCSVHEGEQLILEQLSRLGKPLGIITHQDASAAFVSRFCQLHGLRVPDEIGIIGVDNDPTVCTATSPPLSSVRVPWQLIGERMALTIQGLLGGQTRPPLLQTVPAFGVQVRGSTDLLNSSAADPLLRRFLAQLRKHPKRSIAAIAAHLKVSRDTLHSRVRQASGRCPQDHVHDLRVQRACELLGESDDNLEQIAHACGYSSRELLHRAFSARMGMPPGRWREG